MASVTIGGRELKVLGREDAGGFRRDVDLARLGAEMSEAKTGVETFTKMAEMVHAYVRGNEGVTLDWVIDQLPADIGSILRACVVASGREVVTRDAAPGEAAVPETRV